MKMIIRPYQTTDCSELARLFYDTVHTVNAADYSPEQLNAWATGNVDAATWNDSFLRHTTAVAVVVDQIVGFGDMDETGYLDRLYVHRGFQGKGIATAICSWLEEKVKTDRYVTHASITARPFFAKRGYRVLKEQTVQREGIYLTNYVMEKCVSKKNLYDDDAFFAAYSQMPRSRYGLEGAGEWHQLQPLFPELEGKTVLDLGCGYGWHCKFAAEQGALSVLGVDQSRKMIDEAQRRNSAQCITFRVCSLEDFEYPQETYDLVVSNLVLHYVANLDEVYRKIYQTLKKSGYLLFNIEHPTFTAGVNQQFSIDGAWPVTDYFCPGARTVDFLGHPVTKQHHTLTQIMMGLINCGFSLEAVEEAMPPEQWRTEMPDEMRRPMMLLIKAKKV